MDAICFPNRLGCEKSRVLLEAYFSGNQEELWNLIRSDRKNPKRKEIWPGIQSLESLRTYMNACDFRDTKSEEYGFLIRNRRQAVGTFHVQDVNWAEGTCEVGYWLHHGFTGRGFVAESLRLIEMALCEIGVKKTVIDTKDGNAESWAVAERAGYTLIRRFHSHRECQGCPDCTRIYEKVLLSR
jgi:RimJ/RimL family protein N-acetyltransferase